MAADISRRSWLGHCQNNSLVCLRFLTTKQPQIKGIIPGNAVCGSYYFSLWASRCNDFPIEYLPHLPDTIVHWRWPALAKRDQSKGRTQSWQTRSLPQNSALSSNVGFYSISIGDAANTTVQTRHLVNQLHAFSLLRSHMVCDRLNFAYYYQVCNTIGFGSGGNQWF